MAVTLYANRRMVVTPSTGTVTTLAKAKAHLKITGTAENSYIDALIDVAEMELSKYCWRQFLTCLQKAYFRVPENWTINGFANNLLRVELNGGPCQSVVSVQYYDEDNALQTLDTADYIVESNLEPAIITIINPPSFSTKMDSQLIVNFYGGYASSSVVPHPIQQAILIRIGTLYEQRQEIALGVSVSEIPLTCVRLLSNYRLFKPIS